MSLQDKLTAMKDTFESKMAPDTITIMHRATADLVRSSIIEQVLKVGALAPQFILPNQEDQLVNSAALLAKGPLVINFYRGVW
jgi:predicted aconitase with swiveling domain